MLSMPTDWPTRVKRSALAFIRADALALVLTLTLAAACLGAVIGRCGALSAPLDDSYIHFTYARSFARLQPFVYSAGAAPSSGTTSLLWPALLAPFEALLGGGKRLLWVCVVLGFASLWGLARETRLLAQHLVDTDLARLAGLLPLCFGAFSWFACSGMETLPFTWLLTHAARRCVDLDAARAPGSNPRGVRWLCAVAWLCPLLRPEGVLACAWVALTLWRSRARLAAGVAVFGIVLPGLILLLFTGSASPTTARAKWMLFDPYSAADTAAVMSSNLGLWLTTLLDGRDWSPMFLPEGAAPLGWLALATLATAALHARARYAALTLLWVAGGLVMVSSYETFLVNRLRYLWPFFTPWLLGLVVLARTLVLPWKGSRPRLARGVARIMVLGVGAGLASKLPSAIEDLAESADAIDRQQVSLALWVRNHLPKDAVLGVNDTGALAYFSQRRTFDLVGLTTRGEATHWRAGPGSRFEHYEHLTAAAMPTHFAVYPEWFANDLLLGPMLAERHVEATILGGSTLRLYQADYRALGSASSPQELTTQWQVVDELDVADLESEHAHDYRVLPSSVLDNRVYGDRSAADGGRGARNVDHFTLTLSGQCALALRVYSSDPIELRLQVGDAEQVLPVGAEQPWSERRIELPSASCSGRAAVRITGEGNAQFSALHYWSLSKRQL